MEESKMSFFNDIVFKEFNMNNSKNGKGNEEEDFPSIRRQGSLFRTNIDLLNCFDHDEDQEEKKQIQSLPLPYSQDHWLLIRF